MILKIGEDKALMNTSSNDTPKKPRFFRDGAPYFPDFELVVSKIFEREGHTSQTMVSVLMNLMKDIYVHLADCQTLLGKTEGMVEYARINKKDPQEIESLVSLCREIQSVQMHLAESIKRCVIQITEAVYPAYPET